MDGMKGLGRLLSEGLGEDEKRRGGQRSAGNTLASIQQEILQEIASNAGRYGAKLTELLTTLQALGERIEAEKEVLKTERENGEERINRLIERFNTLRQEADMVRHYLIIHREAMGLWAHEDVFRLYPLPTPLPLLGKDTGRRRAE